MKKLSIPRTRQEATPGWVSAVTDNLEVVTGRRGKVEPLPLDATLSDVVDKINEILVRLQQ